MVSIVFDVVLLAARAGYIILQDSLITSGKVALVPDYEATPYYSSAIYEMTISLHMMECMN